MTIDKYVFSSRGGRERNEDAAFAFSEDDKGIFIVADGLGGHKDGNVASSSTVEYFRELWLGREEEALTKEWIEAAIRGANDNLLSLQKETRSNMRSTLALLLVDGENSFWANVGDSRVYFIRGGELAKITEDHSFAFLKFKSGDIRRADIVRDADQSRLLRSIGDESRNVPDVYENRRPLKKDDAFMLCSDGLWEYLNDDEVMTDYLKSDGAREWAERLLLRAISRIRSGNDNLSIVTAIVKES